MDHTANWKPDPFGTHELRFFSADGRPTQLVMDGGKRSYDKPPTDQGERPATTAQANSASSVLAPQVSDTPHPPSAPSVAPSPDDVPHPSPSEVGEAELSLPAVVPTSDATGRHPHVADPVPMSAEPLSTIAVDRQQSAAAYSEPEPMSHALKMAYAIVLGVMALCVLGLAYVHLLDHSGDGHSAQAAPRKTTTTLAHVTTTTAAVLPSTLSPNAEAAATALISSWSTNNRSAALTVATPTAVGTLFGVPYPGGLAIARGCSTISPIVCTYGPPGGASPTDPIYQIKVSQVGGGWYVSSVKIEN